MIALRRIDHVCLQGADADLRPRQILKDRHLPTRPPGCFAHALGVLGMHLPVAVREVQARDVEARLHHPGERVGIARSGSDGGNDLRVSHEVSLQYQSEIIFDLYNTILHCLSGWTCPLPDPSIFIPARRCAARARLV